MTSDVRDLLRTRLEDCDPDSHPGVGERTAPDTEPLATFQEQLYAEGTRSLLLVLQGMDTSGKDGTIRHVVGAVDPVGVRITSFKKPTAEELSHDFLWRIRKGLPVPGQLAVFNRSHYEDVGVVKVHQLVPDEEIEPRYGAINDFEREVVQHGTTVVKCFLHISYDEQRQRLLERLDDPTKRWKFREGDLDERARWPDYMSAYARAIDRCDTDVAPWYVVPADRKWYRNWAITQLLLAALTDLGPRYPQPDLDVPALKQRLAPPH